MAPDSVKHFQEYPSNIPENLTEHSQATTLMASVKNIILRKPRKAEEQPREN